MPRQIVDKLLPTTMIGSYPKPRWYARYNLHGQDLLEWWKLEENEHAYWDATTAALKDQERAGLDILTDGQMHFDDYGGGIGSFVWYWYERIDGFTRAKLPNPLARQQEARGKDADLSQAAWLDNWGGTAVTKHVGEGVPGRLTEMFRVARQLTDKPLKVSVGAGPPNLTYHVNFAASGSYYSSPRQLAEDLVPLFNRDLKELAAAGADFIQI
jgi:5-methyltetrahydropteroyltriglutamate--homocysteine methyltransferase